MVHVQYAGYGNVYDPFRNSSMVLDAKQGDVNGDGVIDQVYLTGNRSADPSSPFIQNIQLVVRDGRTGRDYVQALKENAGYNPRIFLGDFSSDGVEDILINIVSGGSGALTFDYLYSFLNNQFRQLYDNEWFYQKYSDIVVTYENNYKVRLVNRSLGKEFIIDISQRDAEYLNDLYNADGTLKKPVSGSVNPVSGVYPIDLEGDGIYELWPFQRVIGLYNADSLGYLQTPLSWNKSASTFTPVYQWASVYGKDL